MPFDTDAMTRLAFLSDALQERMPRMLADDGAPHPELLDFCDRHDVSLDSILRGTAPPRESASSAEFVLTLFKLKQSHPDSYRELVQKVFEAVRDMHENKTEETEALRKQGLDLLT